MIKVLPGSVSVASEKSNSDILERAFDLCLRKTRGTIKLLASAPKSAPWAIDGDYFKHHEGFYEIGNWTSSFFTGMALLAWQEREDEFFLKQVLNLAPFYREKVFKYHLDTHHDLGFLYSLYSVALYKLTGDKRHRETGVRAAELLGERFNKKGNFIRAWGRMDTDEFNDMAIIDCLMNLPLLHWAAAETENSMLRNIAIKHAEMALNVFVRPDDSVYHAYRFNLKNGQPKNGDTYGGCAIESQWARGMAWAIYGFALSYRYTGEMKYLNIAERLARKFIQHLDGDIVPMWDFKLSIAAPRIRDASAGSIAVCGFQELLKHLAKDAEILRAKDKLLLRLCRTDYLDFNMENPGIQKLGQIGDAKLMAVNAYTSWGDYFLMEALSRELRTIEPSW